MTEPSFGTWPPGGSGAGGALVPVGWAEIQLGVGTESINHQVGGLFTGNITVNGTGDWDVEIDPAAALLDPFRIAVIATPMEFACVILVATFQLPSFVMSLNAYNAAGAHTNMARCSVVVWYDP